MREHVDLSRYMCVCMTYMVYVCVYDIHGYILHANGHTFTHT